MANPVNICCGFSDDNWKDLRKQIDAGDESAWQSAVGVFERRISERFFDCIDVLIAADLKSDTFTPGFSIVALCCLLTETLQVFRQKPKNKLATSDQFKQFLARAGFSNAFADPKIAESFVVGVRHGILHEAETRGWVIQRDKPTGQIIEERGGRYALNRTEFYAALQKEFRDYVRELRDPANLALRIRFVEKMDEIVGLC